MPQAPTLALNILAERRAAVLELADKLEDRGRVTNLPPDRVEFD